MVYSGEVIQHHPNDGGPWTMARSSMSQDDDDWCFTDTFVHKEGEMSQVTSKGNEAKSRMKQPSDMPTPRFKHE